MKHSEILEILYGDDVYKILGIINSSYYASEYNPLVQSCVVHTGFVFKTHKGTHMELFFDVSTAKVIRQSRNDSLNLPCVNGLILIKKGSLFYNACENFGISTLIGFDEVEKYEIKDEGMFIKSKPYPDNIKVVKEGQKEESLLKGIEIVTEDRTFYVALNRIFPIAFYKGSHSFILEQDEGQKKHARFQSQYGDNYGAYAGTYAQDEMDLSDDFINDVLDGDPDAYWNID